MAQFESIKQIFWKLGGKFDIEGQGHEILKNSETFR